MLVGGCNRAKEAVRDELFDSFRSSAGVEPAPRPLNLGPPDIAEKLPTPCYIFMLGGLFIEVRGDSLSLREGEP